MPEERGETFSADKRTPASSPQGRQAAGDAGDSEQQSAADKSAALPPLRADLRIAHRIAPQGEEFILQDGDGRQFFRLQGREWAVARLLDGRRTAAEVAAEVSASMLSEPVTAAEVEAFVHQLAMAGVLRLSGPAELRRLKAGRRRDWTSRLASLAGRVFYFRIPLGNPDAVACWLARRLGWLYSAPVRWAAVMLVILSAAALLWRVDYLLAPRAEFLSPQGLLWLLAALVMMKVVHELAHAVTCRHYGGHVPEAGLAFIVLTPCLYCDVSSAWMLPERRRRMAVTAAGIVVELLVAALAALVFVITRPGWLHQVAFSLMVVGGVQTLLLNGNPLLRFDGYYLLSDWLEVPNLRLRSRRFLSGLARRLFLGTAAPPADEPPRHRLLLAAYAIASYLYGWLVLYVILGLVYWKLSPLGLQAVASALIGLTVLTQVALPAWLAVRQLVRLACRRGQFLRFVRAATVLALLVLAAMGLLAIPVDEQVTRSFVLEPVGGLDVRAERGGRVVRVLAGEGQTVKSGDLLAEMVDDSLELQLQDAASLVEEAELWRDVARQHDGPLAAAEAERQLAEARRQEESLRQRLEALQVRAPRDGLLLTVPAVERVGLHVPAGTLLARVAPQDQLQASVQLSASDARRVPTGASADLRLRADPGATIRGRVVGNGWQAAERVHPAHTVAQHGEAALVAGGVPGEATFAASGLAASGRLAGEAMAAASAVRPVDTLYRTDILLFDTPPGARPGMTGRARIYLGRTTIGGLLWQSIVGQLNLDLLLPN